MTIRITLAELRKLEQDGEIELVRYSSEIGKLGDEVRTRIALDKPLDIATGAEIKDFWDNGWDGNYFHDDWEVAVQDDVGNWILEDDKLYDLNKLGCCVWQGGSLATKPHSLTFVEAFLAWKNKK